MYVDIDLAMLEIDVKALEIDMLPFGYAILEFMAIWGRCRTFVF